MPRIGRVPKYRLHKTTGRAVVTIDGRDFYLGPYNSPESRAKYDELRRDDLLRLARDRVARGFTPEERELYAELLGK
jgi:hypothetical protein